MDEEELATRRKAAAAWYAELRAQDAGVEIWEAFRDWERDPHNAAAFRYVESVLRVLDDATASASVQEVKKWNLSKTVWVALVCAAASILIVAGVSINFTERPSELIVYATAVGEQLDVNLSDGSTVSLNTESRIVVSFTENERRVKLMEGQALFTVVAGQVPFFCRSSGNKYKGARNFVRSLSYDCCRSSHPA